MKTIKFVKAFFVFVIVATLIVGLTYLEIKEDSESEYIIMDFRGVSYKTTEFEKQNNCITFVSKETGKKVEICGTYQIIENPNFK